MTKEYLLERDVIISFVGLSGTGKSLCRRVVQNALAIHGTSAGDMMRAHILSTRRVDLEHVVGNITADDDRMVDQATILWLKRSGARTIDGRTPGLFLNHMERTEELPRGRSLKVAVTCDPEIRATRALSKFQKKPGLRNITVPGVMELQSSRDLADTERLIIIHRKKYDIASSSDLYGMPPNDLEIDTAICTPEEALLIVLRKLFLMDAIAQSSMEIASERGKRAINRFMKK